MVLNTAVREGFPNLAIFIQALSSKVYALGFIIKRFFVVSKAFEITAQSWARSSVNLSVMWEMTHMKRMHYLYLSALLF